MCLIKKIVFIFILLYCTNYLTAQTIYSAVTNTGASFLNNPVDITQVGMGNTCIATESNAYSALSNPSKILFGNSSLAFAATYSPWLNNFGATGNYITSLSCFKQLDNKVFSLNLRYFKMGSILFSDDNGNPLFQFSPYEMSGELAYSQNLGSQFAISTTLKYIHSALINGVVNNVNYHAGNAVAADVSLLYNGQKDNGEGFSAGFQLNNLGSKLKYSHDNEGNTFLPATMGIGCAYKYIPEDNINFVFALDLRKLLVPSIPSFTGNYKADSIAEYNYSLNSVPESWLKSFSDGTKQLADFSVSLGIEFTYDNLFSIRTGLYKEAKNQGSLNYASFGLGFKRNKIGIDLAYIVPVSSGNYISQNPMQNILQLGLNYSIELENY